MAVVTNFSCKKYDVDNFAHNFLPFPQFGLKIININCRSLRNKFDYFEHFLNSIKFSFDLICVTETWLYDDEVQFFKLPNYKFVGTQRNTRGGGAGVYVRCGMDAEPVVVSIRGADVHSVRLAAGVRRELNKTTLTILYRQPSTDINIFLHDLENLLSSSHTPHIITGDFNIDFLDKQVSENYVNLISLYNFTNVINIPTYYSTSFLKWSCLDHMLTNIYDFEITSGIIDTDFSDHFPTFMFFKFDTNSMPANKELTTFTCINYMKLNRILEKIKWTSLLDINNVDLMYNNFISQLNLSIDECKEQKTVKTKNSSFQSKPWITSEIKYNLKTSTL